MKKANKFLPLLILPLLLGCSNVTIKKVDFGGYGKEVSASEFNSRFEMRYLEMCSDYFTNGKASNLSYLKDNVVIESFLSEVYESKALTEGSSDSTSYTQVVETSVIDISNKRFLKEGYEKRYETNSKYNTRYQYLHNFYGELLSDRLYFVNLETKEYIYYDNVQYAYNYASMFWTDFFGENSLVPKAKDYSASLYYIKNNKFTCERKDDSGNLMIEQYVLETSICYKTKVVNVVRDSYHVETTTNNMQIEMKKTNKEVKQLQSID